MGTQEEIGGSTSLGLPGRDLMDWLRIPALLLQGMCVNVLVVLPFLLAAALFVNAISGPWIRHHLRRRDDPGPSRHGRPA